MNITIGGVLCGLGIGTAFVHNGSSGGTDIIAAMASKKSNVSIGRMMLYTDVVIISSSFFLFHHLDKWCSASWCSSLCRIWPTLW